MKEEWKSDGMGRGTAKIGAIEIRKFAGGGHFAKASLATRFCQCQFLKAGEKGIVCI